MKMSSSRIAGAVLVAATFASAGVSGSGSVLAKSGAQTPASRAQPPARAAQRVYLACTATTATIQGLNIHEYKVHIRNSKGFAIKSGQTIHWQQRVRKGQTPGLAGAFKLNADLQPGHQIDFKVRARLSGCSAWLNALAIR